MKNIFTEKVFIFNKRVKIGFTLAEVLITLAIIGIVAAMTIPNLMQKSYEKETVVKLKKVYSTLNQAYLRAREEYGSPSDWYHSSSEGNKECNNTMLDNFSKYLKVSKICYQDTGCYPNVIYKKIDKTNNANWNMNNNVAKLLTSDGMSIFFFSYCGNPRNPGINHIEETWGAISVDINGFKKPNVMGEDTFSFVVAENGIFPVGDEFWENHPNNSFEKACNIKSCWGNCESCSGWVIKVGNMDYLHCDDLSWSGKHACLK